MVRHLISLTIIKKKLESLKDFQPNLICIWEPVTCQGDLKPAKDKIFLKTFIKNPNDTESLK